MTFSTLLVRARALTGFAELVTTAGGDVDALLADAQLPADLLSEPERSFPLITFAELLEHSAQALHMPDFGIRLANHQDVSVLGVVALIAQHSHTVGEAMAAAIRYMPYHSPGMQPILTLDGGNARLAINHDDIVGRPGERHLCELSFVVAIEFIRMAARMPGEDWELTFTHAAGLSAEAYRAAYGCRVSFLRPDNMLTFPASLLDAKISSGNTTLRATAERFINHQIRRHPLNLGRQIEELVEDQLAIGSCTLPEIARQLGLTQHDLQRRLGANGLRFEDIIDNLRRRRAESLLPHAEIPLSEVAYLLGYNCPSSFTRACKRWYGKPPQHLRQQYLSPPAASA